MFNNIDYLLFKTGIGTSRIYVKTPHKKQESKKQPLKNCLFSMGDNVSFYIKIQAQN